MNIKSIFTLLLLLITIIFVGCYTKLGYYEVGHLDQKQDSHIEKTEKEAESDTSDGYYGRRKPIYRHSRSYVRDSYWVPYTLHYNAYYPPYAYSYYHPWYYGYNTPYYGYYPYRSYGPYRGYYGRYRGSRVYHTSRGTYKNRAVLKGQRRAHYTRSVTSRNSLSERSQEKRR